VKGVNTTGGWNTGGWNTGGWNTGGVNTGVGGVNTGVAGVNTGVVGVMGSVPPHPVTPHSDWDRIRPVVCTGCVLAKTSSHCRVVGLQRAWVAVGVMNDGVGTKFVVAEGVGTKFVVAEGVGTKFVVAEGVVTKFVVVVLPVATAAETCCCVATFK
jgi:hypothetical protein